MEMFSFLKSSKEKISQLKKLMFYSELSLCDHKNHKFFTVQKLPNQLKPLYSKSQRDREILAKKSFEKNSLLNYKKD